MIPTNKPIARLDENDLVFKTEAEKFEAIADEIMDRSKLSQAPRGYRKRREVQVLSRALKRRKIGHEILNAKCHEREAEIVAQAGRKSAVTIATNMAGRERIFCSAVTLSFWPSWQRAKLKMRTANSLSKILPSPPRLVRRKSKKF